MYYNTNFTLFYYFNVSTRKFKNLYGAVIFLIDSVILELQSLAVIVLS